MVDEFNEIEFFRPESNIYSMVGNEKAQENFFFVSDKKL